MILMGNSKVVWGGGARSSPLPDWAIFFIKQLPQLTKLLASKMLYKTSSNITALKDNHTKARL